MEIEDEIKFADISEVFIQNLDKALHQFKNNQLVLLLVNDCYEIQTGKSFVDYLVFLVI